MSMANDVYFGRSDSRGEKKQLIDPRNYDALIIGLLAVISTIELAVIIFRK